MGQHALWPHFGTCGFRTLVNMGISRGWTTKSLLTPCDENAEEVAISEHAGAAGTKRSVRLRLVEQSAIDQLLDRQLPWRDAASSNHHEVACSK